MTLRSSINFIAIAPLVLCVGLVNAADDVVTKSTPQPSLKTADNSGEAGLEIIRQFFEYDASIPLEARIVEKKNVDGIEREKIVFRGCQGFLVPGYFQLPPEDSGKVPCVLLLHGWSGSKESWFQKDNYISGSNIRNELLQSGYAVLILDAQCHGDRISTNDFAPVNHYRNPEVAQPRKGYFTQREIYMQTVIDYRRAIDYLATRAEIDTSRIGMIGYSMGGTQTFMLTGVDDRIRTSVACVTPAEKSKWSPIAPQNYVPSLANRPFLMIMGKTDTMCPIPHAQAVHRLIQQNTTDSDLILMDAGHRLQNDYVPHAIGWIKKHL